MGVRDPGDAASLAGQIGHPVGTVCLVANVWFLNESADQTMVRKYPIDIGASAIHYIGGEQE